MLGIIQMESDDLLFPEERIHLFDSCVPPLESPNHHVASGKKMSRVNTNREPLWELRRVENRGKMFKLVSEATPLPRRVFKRDANGQILCLAKNFIQTSDDLTQPFLLPSAKMRSWMQDEKWQFECGGEREFLDERLDRFCSIVRRPGSEIDEVTGMAENGRESSRVSVRPRNFSTSPSGCGLPNHCMLFLTKIWTDCPEICSARRRAMWTPPAVEQCAPKIIAECWTKSRRVQSEKIRPRRLHFLSGMKDFPNLLFPARRPIMMPANGTNAMSTTQWQKSDEIPGRVLLSEGNGELPRLEINTPWSNAEIYFTRRTHNAFSTEERTAALVLEPTELLQASDADSWRDSGYFSVVRRARG